LADGQQLKHTGYREKGFMGEKEFDDYDVVDATGAVVGSVTHHRHIAVRGFERSEMVEQRDADGKLIVNERWTPAE